MKFREYKNSNISFIEISGEHFSVTLSNLGASIYSIKYDEDYLTLTPDKVFDFAKPNVYHGKTIGFVANRLKDGIAHVNGHNYKLKPNEGNNVLHGGLSGLSNKLFNTKIFEVNGELLVKFDFSVKDFSDDLPGNRTVVITYKIAEHDSLEILLDMYVSSDKDTLIRLTNHTYFSLGEADIRKLELYLPAESFIVPSSIDLCPIKEAKLIEALDFNSPALIEKATSDIQLINSNTKGIDHFFLFGDKKVVKLVGEKYSLTIKTDFPGVQLYSDGNIDGIKYKNTKKINYRGLAIEPGDSHLDNTTSKQYLRHIVYKLSKNLLN